MKMKEYTTLQEAENDLVLQSLVDEEVEWTFGDWPEGHGIGSSDISAVVNYVISKVKFAVDPMKVRLMVNDALAIIEEDSHVH